MPYSSNFEPRIEGKMLLVGKLLKETIKQGQLRKRHLSVEHHLKIEEQRATLHELLNESRNTAFSRYYGVDNIPEVANCENEFRRKVPLFKYEAFYHKWLKQAINDEPNVIHPGKTQFFALSSGTTNDSSKRIPVSDKMVRHFQKITIRQIMELSRLELSDAFYNSKVLTVGGSTKLKRVGEHFEGDLSGILAGNKSFAVTPFARPKKRIAQISDWNVKLQSMVNSAPKWNIGVIAGVPSWVCFLLEAIIEQYKLNNIHEVWPNLSLYLHGGIFLEPYKERLEKCLGREIYYQNTYLASEGYIAYQRSPGSDGMELLSSSGIYFEFIEQDYFDDINNNDLERIPTLTLSEVQENTPYAIVLTTCSGLRRYIIGDVIEFSNIKTCTMRILGRISSSLNLFGEHLSEGNIRAAIQQTAQQLKISVEEFCVYPAQSKDRHNWYIGSNQRIDTNIFSVLLNEKLAELNDDYATIRKHLLKAPRIKALPVQKFYEYLEYKNKLGGQNKFPRVMTSLQAKDWERFLTATNYLADQSSLPPTNERIKYNNVTNAPSAATT